MKNSGPKRNLEQSLAAYAMVATAAGVGAIALSPWAEAKIVYTPANISIPVNGGAVLLDLNQDGVADFSFQNTSTGGNPFDLFLTAKALAQSNVIWGGGLWTESEGFAAALKKGHAVKADKSYFGGKGRWLMALKAVLQVDTYGSFIYTYGQWLYAKHRYLGLKFLVDGKTHYGWARLSVDYQRGHEGLIATITGYAYETVPDKSIIAGRTKGPEVIVMKPVTLGSLARGSSGAPRGPKNK